MVTSSGRIVLAPAGGEEKRAKQELSLLSPDCSWRSQQDAKGQLVWCVDTVSDSSQTGRNLSNLSLQGGQHYTFEETKSPSSWEGGRNSVEEWIDCLERARDLAISQNAASQAADEAFAEISSSVSSPASTLGGRTNYTEGFSVSDRSNRNHLSKGQNNTEETQSKRNRFSKRQSRNGLGSAF